MLLVIYLERKFEEAYQDTSTISEVRLKNLVIKKARLFLDILIEFHRDWMI